MTSSWLDFVLLPNCGGWKGLGLSHGARLVSSSLPFHFNRLLVWGS
jgi:hypothetical protein